MCVGRQEDDQSLLAASCRAVGPYLEEIRRSDKTGHLMSSSRLCIHKHGHMGTCISHIYTVITEKMAEVPLTTTQASGHTLFQWYWEDCLFECPGSVCRPSDRLCTWHTIIILNDHPRYSHSKFGKSCATICTRHGDRPTFHFIFLICWWNTSSKGKRIENARKLLSAYSPKERVRAASVLKRHFKAKQSG